jgi:hypothetical protein
MSPHNKKVARKLAIYAGTLVLKILCTLCRPMFHCALFVLENVVLG